MWSVATSFGMERDDIPGTGGFWFQPRGDDPMQCLEVALRAASLGPRE
jgi:hypothetical protein